MNLLKRTIKLKNKFKNIFQISVYFVLSRDIVPLVVTHKHLIS